MQRLFLVCAAALVAAPLPGAPVPEEKPKLLFVSSRTGQAQIFLVSVDGTGAENLTNHPSEHAFPAWSPDGRQIAFIHNAQTDTYTVYVMDADGENRKVILKDGQATDSPRVARQP